MSESAVDVETSVETDSLLAVEVALERDDDAGRLAVVVELGTDDASDAPVVVVLSTGDDAEESPVATDDNEDAEDCITLEEENTAMLVGFTTDVAIPEGMARHAEGT